MMVNYVKEELGFNVCDICGKIYLKGETPEEGCCEGGNEFVYYRVADIVGWNYNFAMEIKKGNDLVSSLQGNRLYYQLEKMKAFFGSCWALVFVGSFEKLLIDPYNKERVGQIRSIPALVMQYGGSFIQVSNLASLVPMLKYFSDKCGEEPKLRLRYSPIDDSMPKLVRLLCTGVKGINIKIARNIFSQYSNLLDLAIDLSQGKLKKIPKIGPKWTERLKKWLL